MKIESHSGRIVIDKSSFIDVMSAMIGSGVELNFLNDIKVYIVSNTKVKNPAVRTLVFIPNEEWRQDLIDSGYEILGEL